MKNCDLVCLMLDFQFLNKYVGVTLMVQEEVIRQLLMVIDRNPAISQKRLAEEIGLNIASAFKLDKSRLLAPEFLR